jgi:ectoine hydroxylase-related dioxygenase (phytanoyl-CoA dioxygenase family)
VTPDAPDPLAALERDGYAVLERVIEAELVGALLETVDRVMVDADIPFGTNAFLGVHTRRIFNLLARDPLFARVPLHPAVLPLVEQVLDEQCLLSSLTAIEMQPGQEAQPLHCDDGSIALPRPHPTVVCVAL